MSWEGGRSWAALGCQLGCGCSQHPAMDWQKKRTARRGVGDWSWLQAHLRHYVLSMLHCAVLSMLCCRLPEGDYRALRASGALQQPPLAAALREAAANLSVWALALAYSMTFGVELTINK